ncbi:non-oxidative hydroxyarylic acid decarboxylases subunit D [Photobacterium swingsii]|uniref:Hydroxyaromatic non-oxidative decarboxylase protein D n=2 Tax=Vibrio TaxID=662 RepID=A0A0H3ZQC9_9VIBR|nr:Hydroxyaromatic non-oxidative decarboxylase protein D [Vibrio tasmaniensis]AKN40858.1 Hydroxyaromatic non-oxidative decarboxylase protein D [Vibrio sp. 1F_189]
MVCPRCGEDHVEILAKSPVPKAWKVLQCQHCLYTWRTTEPARRTDPALYPEEFKMTQADIDNAPMVPSIPPLLPASER